MQRKKQHRSVLKGLLKDERTSPDRAILIEQILKCTDAVDEDGRGKYELLVMHFIGGDKLVEYYLDRLDKCSDKRVKPLLTDADEHVTNQNKLFRDKRSHPNRRFVLQIEAMNESADTEHERLFYMTILLTACLDTQKRFKLAGFDEEPLGQATSRADRDAMDSAKQFLDKIMGGASAG